MTFYKCRPILARVKTALDGGMNVIDELQGTRKELSENLYGETEENHEIGGVPAQHESHKCRQQSVEMYENITNSSSDKSCTALGGRSFVVLIFF